MHFKKLLRILRRLLIILGILLVFLLSLDLMSNGFKLLSKDLVDSLFTMTSNPVISLFIGLFATALMQSSSTTTSIIVALVASGTLTLENAVPMVMGANIGTSVTSTIVALGHIQNKYEFRHAISAATVHDMFNILVVAILLPVELMTGVLSQTAIFLASKLPVFDGSSGGISVLDMTIKPLSASLLSLMGSDITLILMLSFLLLVSSLRGFTLVLRQFLIGKSQEIIDKYVFGNPIRASFWGAAITAGVQSSSVTASLTVPLVASNRASLKQVFPFLIGANVGTTFTALLASLSQNETAMAIAICHLLFNLGGVLLLFPIKYFRNIPVWLAEKLGKASYQNRMIGIAYVLIVFFLIPLLFIVL